MIRFIVNEKRDNSEPSGLNDYPTFKLRTTGHVARHGNKSGLNMER